MTVSRTDATNERGPSTIAEIEASAIAAKRMYARIPESEWLLVDQMAARQADEILQLLARLAAREEALRPFARGEHTDRTGRDAARIAIAETDEHGMLPCDACENMAPPFLLVDFCKHYDGCALARTSLGAATENEGGR